jgi:hypothetical protein
MQFISSWLIFQIRFHELKSSQLPFTVSKSDLLAICICGRCARTAPFFKNLVTSGGVKFNGEAHILR